MNKNLHISFISRSAFILVIILMGFTTAYSQSKAIKCYPNPATTIVNFEFQVGTQRTAQLQIYSFSGKKMTTLPVSSDKITVTLDNEYYRGIYIYQLRDKNGKIIETGKFQVVK